MKKFGIAVGACLVALQLSACSGKEATNNDVVVPVVEAKAKFSTDTGRIVMPLDEYDFYKSDKYEESQYAVALVTNRCMESQGSSYPTGSLEDSKNQYEEDRTYGLWDIEQAKRFGFDVEMRPANDARQELESKGGEEWIDKVNACFETNNALISTFRPSDQEYNESITGRLIMEGHDLTQSDAKWTETKESWWKCLESEGLTPIRETSSLSAKESEERPKDSSASSLESSIKLAVIEATCNQETGMAQKLADLEAGYQQGLINKNQAALNEVKTKNKEYAQAAVEFLAENG